MVERYRFLAASQSKRSTRSSASTGLEDDPGVVGVPGLVIFRFQPGQGLVEEHPAGDDVAEIPVYQQVAALLVEGSSSSRLPVPVTLWADLRQKKPRRESFP